MNNLVVFASGSGSNFQSIIDAISEGKLTANIVGFISNNETATSVKRAKKNDIPVLIISESQFKDQDTYSDTLLSKLDEWNADVLILAGFLKKIPSKIISAYENNILNIHPSLLPKYGGKGFFGMKVHEAVIANNETESGCSVHIVTEEYDEGPVIGQSKVSVLASDTSSDLAERVLEQEHKLYPLLIKKHLESLNK